MVEPTGRNSSLLAQQQQSFLGYLQEYRTEPNEFLRCLFVERAFKYAELQLIDCLTGRPITQAVVFSGVCLDKFTASVCFFDVSTLFDLLFPTDSLKVSYEENLDIQSAFCPSCGEPISFNFLVFDTFLQSFLSSTIKAAAAQCSQQQSSKAHEQINSRTALPTLTIERIRGTNSIRYSSSDSQYHYEGLQILNFDNICGEEYPDFVQHSKQEEEAIDQNIPHSTINESIDQQERSSSSRKDRPFRVLRVKQKETNIEAAADSVCLYSILSDKLVLWKSTKTSCGRSLLEEFREISLDFKITSSNLKEKVDEEDLLDFQSVLVEGSTLLLVTQRNIYSVTLSEESPLVAKQIYTFATMLGSVPQLKYFEGNLYLIEVACGSSQQQLVFRIIEDVLLYPEEAENAPQPEIYLEIDCVSGKEKVLLLVDEFAREVLLISSDEVFRMRVDEKTWVVNEELGGISFNEGVLSHESLFANSQEVFAVSSRKNEFIFIQKKSGVIITICLEKEPQLKSITDSKINVASTNSVIHQNGSKLLFLASSKSDSLKQPEQQATQHDSNHKEDQLDSMIDDFYEKIGLQYSNLRQKSNLFNFLPPGISQFSSSLHYCEGSTYAVFSLSLE